MSGPSNEKAIFKDYREAVARLGAARSEALEERKSIEVPGDEIAGAQSLEKLRVAVDEFKELRSKVSPADLFVIEYNVEVITPTRVSLVIPANVSPMDVVLRIDDVSVEVSCIPAFSPFLMKLWGDDTMKHFSAPHPRKLDVDGFVAGTLGKDLDQQEAILRRRGLRSPSLIELGLAHAAYRFATGEDLFQGKQCMTDGGRTLFVGGGDGHVGTIPIFGSSGAGLVSAARFSDSLDEI